MEIAILSILIILLIAVCTAIVMLYALSKRSGKADTRDVERKLEAEAKSIKEAVELSNSATVNALQSGMKATNEPVLQLVQGIARNNEQRIGEMKEQLGVSLKEMKENVEKNLIEVRNDNAAQLEKIRGTVDEKLTKTIEDKLNASFKNVSDSLDKLYKNLGELKTLDSSLSDINKMLNGVKTRGIWGELSLETLLDEILTPQQYEKQSKMGRRVNEIVDFAIVLPGADEGNVYIPIDCKFPIEDYVRMNDALLAGNVEEYNRSRKELAQAIKTQASTISKKYIAPPKTTNFAIMYLPVESLYAEVLSIEGLAESIQRELRVMIAGPVNITALLNSLRMGFKTLQIKKNSSEVFRILGSFRKDFDTFMDDISRAQKQMVTVQNTLDSAAKRTEIISKKLAKTEAIEGVAEEETELPKLIG